jgi:hypothetical protein
MDGFQPGQQLKAKKRRLINSPSMFDNVTWIALLDIFIYRQFLKQNG